jgi:hypothetical protein
VLKMPFCKFDTVNRVLVRVAAGLYLVAGALGMSLGAFAAPARETLQYFEGSWHCDGVFPSTGRKISAALIFTWYPQTGSTVKQHDDEAPNHFHAVELWAVSTEGFKNTIADASGGVRTYTSTGWDNGVLTWNGGGDQTHKERFVYTRINVDSMRMDFTVSKNDMPFVIGDTLTCSRVNR